ncbi:unnamed protein product [Clavelina lepadiformis]|uniref:LCCL domain-containing protein n=1 Tax=Clavelina lepadiformis TaxID=159417 RepID=A0ABP0G795_CLALP
MTRFCSLLFVVRIVFLWNVVYSSAMQAGLKNRTIRHISCSKTSEEIPWSQARSKFVVQCPASCLDLGSCFLTVTGTTFYTSSSSICCAGIHDGKITNQDGGLMEVCVFRTGRNNYKKSSQHGITSLEHLTNWQIYFTLSGIIPEFGKQALSTKPSIETAMLTNSVKNTFPHNETNEGEDSMKNSIYYNKSTVSQQINLSSTLIHFPTNRQNSIPLNEIQEQDSSNSKGIIPEFGTQTLSTKPSIETAMLTNSVKNTFPHNETNEGEDSMKNSIYYNKSTVSQQINLSSTLIHFPTNRQNSIPLNEIQEQDSSNSKVYLTIALVTSSIAVMLFVSSAWCFKETLQRCATTTCHRRNHVVSAEEECVCYVNLDPSEQSLLQDPDTCERFCDMKKELQSEYETTSRCHVPAECMICPQQKCASKFEF